MPAWLAQSSSVTAAHGRTPALPARQGNGQGRAVCAHKAIARSNAERPLAVVWCSSPAADQVPPALAPPDAVPWLGLKVSRLPADRTAAEVLTTVARNLEVVRRAQATA